MSKAKNNRGKFSIPRNIVFIGTILLTILVIFFVWFGISYSTNHVDPFKEDLSNVEYEKIKPEKISDFHFEFYCSDYMATSSTKAVFKATAYDKADGIGKVSNVSIKVILAANWIGYTSSTASGSLNDSDNWWSSTNHDEDDTDPFTKTSATLTISGISETFPKSSFFLGMKVKPKAYVWLSYTLTKNAKSTVKNYLMVYSYQDYFTDKTL